MSSARFVVSFVLLASAAACSGNRGAGPNYSTTPCADNCGNDAQCQASCTNVRNPNLPPMIYPSPGK
jgi:hypothetical protein